MSDHAHRSLLPSEAFAALSRLRLADHTADSAMAAIADLVRRTLPGTADVSVTVVEGGRPRTAASTGPLALELDELQYADGDGPCLSAIDLGEPVVVPSTASEDRWPRFGPRASERGALSSLSAPVPEASDAVAALNCYGAQERVYSSASVDLAGTFAAYAGFTLGNLRLFETQSRVAEQLQSAMESRAVIEQAKGVLIARQKCSPDDAFETLVERSQTSNTKLRDVARSVVERAREGDDA